MGLEEFFGGRKREEAQALAGKAIALYNMYGTDGNAEFHQTYQSIPQGKERRSVSKIIAEDAAARGDWEVARWMGTEAQLPHSSIIDNHAQAKFVIAAQKHGRTKRIMRIEATLAARAARRFRRQRK